MSVQCNQYLGWGYMLDFTKAQDVLVTLHPTSQMHRVIKM